jgi:hypothetical protein
LYESSSNVGGIVAGIVIAVVVQGIICAFGFIVQTVSNWILLRTKSATAMIQREYKSLQASIFLIFKEWEVGR